MKKNEPATPGQLYIKNLISQGEHQQLDFKFSINDARKIARTLVAFANTDGGKLLIGVKDNGSIAGVRSEEEIYMIDAAAKMYCKPAISIKMNKWIVDGKVILEVDVKKSKDLCYVKDESDKWLVYLRSGDQNVLANNIYIRYVRQKNKNKGVFLSYTVEEQNLISYLSDNKDVNFSTIKRIIRSTHARTEDLIVKLLCMDVLEMKFTDKGAFYNLKK